MKYLTLIRHAKSSWKETDINDLDRPLNSRGLHAIKTMAPRIAQSASELQKIYVSPAKRAVQTARSLANEGAFSPDKLEVVECLYTFNMNDLLTYLVALPDGLQQIAIIGHNPALEELLFWLTGDSTEKFPTLACAKIFLPQVNWSALGPGKGRV
jgi:phosphohistidine phosphatase